MKNATTTDYEFTEVHALITLRRSQALQAVNNENLLAAWEVGAFVSRRLQNAQWGSKTVTQLAEYLRTQDPSLRGFSRRNIYNMIALFETYSLSDALQYVDNMRLNAIVQFQTAQIESTGITRPATAKNEGTEIVQFQTGQFPNFLNLTTLTNHFEILNTCRTLEERIFYVLYAHKERLQIKELRRCLKNNTFATLMNDKRNLSKGLKETYPQALFALKDTLFLDFLNLPQKHSEKHLKNNILDKLKDFILEIGKDFIFIDKEFQLHVGTSTFKVDLLFFHRGLQCLVAVELKTTKFKPEHLGQLEFYLEALDRDARRSNENPSIGILLCQDADKAVVEYAMSRSLSPTMIAEYKRLLIPKEVFQHSLEAFAASLIPKGKAKKT
jgi:predicted nuclease of restriction endonuclease-like (RecB) superfamily